MTESKVTTSLDESTWIVFLRCQAIEEAVAAKLARVEKNRLAQERDNLELDALYLCLRH